ncbi:MAG: alpha/beta hydrolase [Muribaculaceae bacterium]|nr:alpha/beta hydrolase [Muribaculaceae bacterium]
MKKTSVSIVALILSIVAFAQSHGFEMPPMPQPDFADINYAGDDLEGHKLDIYVPKDDKDRHPLIVVIYGSAWFSNNFKNAAYMSLGQPLIDAGYAVACINHRASTEAKYPAQINDVKGAIRFLRANADKYGLDTSFLGITGFSSGGHLSAMAGVTNDMKNRTFGDTTIDIEGNIGGNADQSSSVDAVVDWFGPVDMSRMENCETVKGADSPEAVLMGVAPADSPDMVALISPITYISEKTVPMLVIHGNSDSVVPYCQGVNFSEELRKAGKLFDFITVEGGEHGPVTFNNDTYKAMVDFFNSKRK